MEPALHSRRVGETREWRGDGFALRVRYVDPEDALAPDALFAAYVDMGCLPENYIEIQGLRALEGELNRIPALVEQIARYALDVYHVPVVIVCSRTHSRLYQAIASRHSDVKARVVARDLMWCHGGQTWPNDQVLVIERRT